MLSFSWSTSPCMKGPHTPGQTPFLVEKQPIEKSSTVCPPCLPQSHLFQRLAQLPGCRVPTETRHVTQHLHLRKKTGNRNARGSGLLVCLDATVVPVSETCKKEIAGEIRKSNQKVALDLRPCIKCTAFAVQVHNWLRIHAQLGLPLSPRRWK